MKHQSHTINSLAAEKTAGSFTQSTIANCRHVAAYSSQIDKLIEDSRDFCLFFSFALHKLLSIIFLPE
jgi:hypothetical protein